MKKKAFYITWFLLLNVFTWTASLGRAVPLSINENIKLISDRQGNLAGGFSFVVIGDSRDGARTYARLLDRAKTFKPLFLLHTGDFVTHGQPSEYKDYMKQIASYDIPVLHVPGNHDVSSGPEVFHRYVGEHNWYIDLNGLRIIGLDNAAGSFSPETATFAQKSLTKHKICLVVFHMPPPIGRWIDHAMSSDPETGHCAGVMDLIKKNHVPIVFLGHIHLFDEMDMNGVKYVVSAGGGARLYSKHTFGKAEYGFVLVQVRPEGITHRWVPLE